MVKCIKLEHKFARRLLYMGNLDNAEGGLTVTQFMHVVKKSLKRGLIYVLASLIVVAAVLLTVKACTSYRISTSTISFAEANKNTLSDLNEKKSTVVNKALSNIYRDGTKALELSNGIVSNLSVTAVVPDNVNKTDAYVATSYILSLTNDKSLNLTKNDYNAVLDEIAKEFINAFALNSLENVSLVYNIDDEIIMNEYFQVADDLYDIVNNYYGHLKNAVSTKASAGDFTSVSTGKSINGTIEELSSTLKNINNLKNLIITDRVETGKLESYLNERKSEANGDVRKYEAAMNAAKTALDKYAEMHSPSSSTVDKNGNNVYVYDDTTMIALTNNYMQAASLHAEANSKAAKIDGYIASISGKTKSENAELIQYVKDKLKAIYEDAQRVSNDYKKIAAEYNNNLYLVSKATVTNPAHAYTDSPISNKITVLALVAVALVAYCVAFTQTYVREKKNFDEKLAG